MREIKIENNPKMIAAMGIIKDALSCHPQRIVELLTDIDDYRLVGFDVPWERVEREILSCALQTLQILQECESIQLNFGEDK